MAKTDELAKSECCRRILELVGRNGTATTAELHAVLPGVSPSRLSNYTKELCQQEKIASVGHGEYAKQQGRTDGANAPPLLHVPKYWERLAAKIGDKRGIARYITRSFVTRDCNLAIDAGTTGTAVFQELVDHPPHHAVSIRTNNLHGALLVSPATRLALSIVGGTVSYDYAATCGTILEEEAGQLDVSIFGFSRISAADGRGVWTLDKPQWEWKRLLCRAKHVVFAGTINKLGETFAGDPICELGELPPGAPARPWPSIARYTVVVSADARGLSAEEHERLEREREALGRHLVLVDAEGRPVDRLEF